MNGIRARMLDNCGLYDKACTTLDMSYCYRVTDAAFVHLAGINTLYMNYCDQETITDAAFDHLVGIYKLNISGCIQETITEAKREFLALSVPVFIDMEKEEDVEDNAEDTTDDNEDDMHENGEEEIIDDEEEINDDREDEIRDHDENISESDVGTDVGERINPFLCVRAEFL